MRFTRKQVQERVSSAVEDTRVQLVAEMERGMKLAAMKAEYTEGLKGLTFAIITMAIGLAAGYYHHDRMQPGVERIKATIMEHVEWVNEHPPTLNRGQ